MPRGRSLLAQRPRCRFTVTRKGSLLCVVGLVTPKQGSPGTATNNQDDCPSGDSRIGFGTGGRYDPYNTCGNEATTEPDNGDKHIKAMGYILVY